MPGKIKVKILAGRNLPVMDRSGDTTDAYVELKFGNVTYKTDVCRKSLNPQWNSEWYRFEVDDAELQDEPLQIRLMDHDTYSANDAIGKVYINLNPLLLPGIVPSVKNIWTLEATMNSSTGAQGSVMSGWIPVYDTMHGIRGEVNIIVKVELFSDFNKFRQSSCGVQFFYSPNIPHGYHAQVIHGFVEELVVSDDPEYKWIDKIRTPRASNEARQTLFFKLSGEVQRKMGLKALDLGGNAVIGYLQNFDLEGESGIVARGIGTAVTLMKLHDTFGVLSDNAGIEEAGYAFSAQSKVHMECTESDDSVPLISSSPSYVSTTFFSTVHPTYKSTKSHGYRGTHGRPVESVLKYIPQRTTTRSSGQGLMKSGKLANLSGRACSAFQTECLFGRARTSSLSRKFRNIKQLSQSMLSLAIPIKSEMSDVFSRDIISCINNQRISSIINPYQYVQKKFTQGRGTNEGMAAVLIKSICTNIDFNEGSKTDTGTQCLLRLDNIKDFPTREPRVLQMCEHEKMNVYDDKISMVELNTESELANEDIPIDSSSAIDTSITHNLCNPERNCEARSAKNIVQNEIISWPQENFTELDCHNNTRCNDIIINGNNDDNSEVSTVVLRPNAGIALMTTAINEKKCTKKQKHFTFPEILITCDDKNDSRRSSKISTNEDNKRVALPIGEINYISDKYHGEKKHSSKEKHDTKHAAHKHKHVHTGRPESTDNLIYQNLYNCSGKLHASKKHHTRKKLMSSTQSLPTLFTLQGFENGYSEGTGNKFRNSEDRIDSMYVQNVNTVKQMKSRRRKKTDSTESSDNTTEDYRLNRMLDLINVIDTKMMCPVEHKNEHIEGKRRRRNKLGLSTTDLTQQRLNTSSSMSVSSLMKRVSSCPKYLSLRNLSVSPLSSCSHISSLECLHNPNASSSLCLLNVPQSSLSETHAYPSYFTRYRESSDYDAVDKSSNSFINTDDIEPNNIKSRSTTFLLSLRKAGSAVCKSHSVFNLREASYHNKYTKPTNTADVTYNSCVSYPSPDLRQQEETSLSPPCPLLAAPTSAVAKASHSPVTKAHNIPLHRRSSDSDLSITPKGNSCAGSDRSAAGFLKASAAIVRTMNQDALEMLEYPFITMQQYPPGFIVHIGGLVSSRSVKLLERISNLEEPEGRDAWWTEIRMEVRSHARALACNVVIGYREETSICDDVCVLNASGTAAVINLHNSTEDQDNVFLNKVQGLTLSSGDADRDKSAQKPVGTKPGKSEDVPMSNQLVHQNGKTRRTSESNEQEVHHLLPQSGCSLCHIPYSEASVPFRVNISKCAICKRAKVPDVMFSTIELPEGIPMIGRGCFIQATVCKNKKDLRGELNAKEISDCLPFLEYELHSLLLNKLKVKGMNAIFGLKIQVSIGERLVIGMAVGTAVFVTALPTASIPQVASGNSWHNEDQLIEIQKSLAETVKRNREYYQLKHVGGIENGRLNNSDTDESDEDLPDLDFGFGARDSYILEVDDIEDIDRISLLMDDRPPDDFHVVNTQIIPGLEDLEIVRNLQMFTQVSRIKIPTSQVTLMPSKYFVRLLQTVYFKLRRMVPCALCNMQFKIALPEPDELQLSVVGMVLGLGETAKLSKHKRKLVSHLPRKEHMKSTDDNDMIFSLDEDHTENSSISENIPNHSVTSSTLTTVLAQKSRQRSPLRIRTHTGHRHKHVPLKERYGVDITPLSYLPGGKVDRYLGNLNFFFIRESTSIRENGGLSGFTHSFVMEVLAIVRAHITALGGNAMLAFFMNQCVLLHSPHKNQGQCLINVGGDVVSVSYFSDEKQTGSHNC